jgi:serine/threonine protein kinase
VGCCASWAAAATARCETGSLCGFDGADAICGCCSCCCAVLTCGSHPHRRCTRASTSTPTLPSRSSTRSTLETVRQSLALAEARPCWGAGQRPRTPCTAGRGTVRSPTPASSPFLHLALRLLSLHPAGLSAETLLRFKAEVDFQRKLSHHPNVVRFIGACCELPAGLTDALAEAASSAAAASSASLLEASGALSSVTSASTGSPWSSRTASLAAGGSCVPVHLARGVKLAIVMELCQLGSLFSMIGQVGGVWGACAAGVRRACKTLEHSSSTSHGTCVPHVCCPHTLTGAPGVRRPG